jgi:hypothetical protein
LPGVVSTGTMRLRPKRMKCRSTGMKMKQRKKYAAEDSLSTEVSVLILRLLGVSNEWRLGREINFIFTTSLDPRRSVGNVLESVQTSSI